jgi:beta-phosphoglucomutase-like phosphatase (HAD superfamily)
MLRPMLMAEPSEGPLVIFDCNGVLVDSEPIAVAVLVEAFRRVGVAARRRPLRP